MLFNYNLKYDKFYVNVYRIVMLGALDLTESTQSTDPSKCRIYDAV